MYLLNLVWLLGACDPDGKDGEPDDETLEAPDTGDVPNDIYLTCADTGCTEATWEAGVVDTDRYAYAWFEDPTADSEGDPDGEEPTYTRFTADLVDGDPFAIGLRVTDNDNGAETFSYHVAAFTSFGRRMAPRTIIVPELSVKCRNCEVRAGISGCITDPSGVSALDYRIQADEDVDFFVFDLHESDGTTVTSGNVRQSSDRVVGAQYRYSDIDTTEVWDNPANGATMATRSVKPTDEYLFAWFTVPAGSSDVVTQTKTYGAGSFTPQSYTATCTGSTTTFCK